MCAALKFHDFHTCDSDEFLSVLNSIGGSGGACRRTSPPTGPNSFIFAYIFTEKCSRWRPKPPKMGPRPLRKILDPALNNLVYHFYLLFLVQGKPLW